MLNLYTDGSSNGRSGGAVGWAWLLEEGEVVVMASYGGYRHGTNNTAELTAAIWGLTHILKYGIKIPVNLVCDSQYVLNIANGNFKASKNLEECSLLRKLAIKINPEFVWVKGHSGNIYNELVDKLSKQGRKENS